MSEPQDFANPYLVIRASAGTGKTFRLSSRYISLLQRDVSVNEILATTFTRKAASEIMQRVLLRLAEAVREEGKLKELADSIGETSFPRPRAEELLQRLARNLHLLRIGTLDSFFAQLATTHSLELGLPPGWQVVEPTETAPLVDRAIEVLLEQEADSIVTRIRHLMPHIGSRQISELIRNTVQNLHETYLATNAEAWQQIPRPKPLQEEEVQQLWDAVLEADLPEDSRAERSRGDDYTRFFKSDWRNFVSKGLAGKVHSGVNSFHKKPIPADTVALYQQLLTHVRALVLREIANQTESSYELLDKFDREFWAFKQDEQLLTFDDVKHALAGSPTANQFQRWRYRLDGQIKHLLLDEFQDTSAEQWRVIEPLAGSLVENPRSTFFCVGDLKQAIYGWRGGIADIFSEAEALPGVKVEQLNQSYRFGPAVVEATNAIFRGIVRHPNLEDYARAVSDWANGFEDHRTAHPEYSGYVRLETTPIVDNDESDQVDTLSFAADRIAELSSEAPSKSIGVLVYRNETVGRMIYELGVRGILASEEGGNPLTDSAAVELVLSVLQLADHPADRVAWFHVAHSPLSEMLGIEPAASAAVRARVAAEVREEIVRSGYGQTIRRWALQLVSSASAREANRLRQLVDVAYEYDHRATLSTSDFINRVRQLKRSALESVQVRVMTIHQAKGLEFDIVVLPELDGELVRYGDTHAIDREGIVGPIHTVCLSRNKELRSLLPPKMQRMFETAADRKMAEALCCLYVAVTRPVHALHMMIKPSTEGEHRVPKTPAGLLRAALHGTDRIGPGEVLYETGDKDWLQSTESSTAPEAQESATPAPVTVRLAKTGSNSVARYAWTSPSRLEGGVRRHPAKLFRESEQHSRGQGTLMHSWLEQITWLEEGQPDERTLRHLARRHEISAESVDSMLQRFAACLASDAGGTVLSRASYQPPKSLPLSSKVLAELANDGLQLEVRREQRIAAQVGDQWLRGNIDRLVLMKQGDQLLAADVIDFKTDAIPNADDGALRERVNFYEPQIIAYRQAVSQMMRLPVERIAARLWFTSVGKIVSIDDRSPPPSKKRPSRSVQLSFFDNS